MEVIEPGQRSRTWRAAHWLGQSRPLPTTLGLIARGYQPLVRRQIRRARRKYPDITPGEQLQQLNGWLRAAVTAAGAGTGLGFALRGFARPWAAALVGVQALTLAGAASYYATYRASLHGYDPENIELQQRLLLASLLREDRLPTEQEVDAARMLRLLPLVLAGIPAATSSGPTSAVMETAGNFFGKSRAGGLITRGAPLAVQTVLGGKLSSQAAEAIIAWADAHFGSPPPYWAGDQGQTAFHHPPS